MCAAYLMTLDLLPGAKLERAMVSLQSQRPTVDIAGGDIQSVGGDGKGLWRALEMYEWELNAEAASGPCSPTLPPRDPADVAPAEDSLSKRKSPHLGPQVLESPSTKKVKAATLQMEEITL